MIKKFIKIVFILSLGTIITSCSNNIVINNNIDQNNCYINYYDNQKDNSIQINEDSYPKELSPYYYGIINTNGSSVYGYKTQSIVDNTGTFEKQMLCSDKCTITAKRSFYSYGILWYECWNSDNDYEYYGWINSEFIIFSRGEYND